MSESYLCSSCIHNGVCVVQAELLNSKEMFFNDGKKAILNMEAALESCDHFTPAESSPTGASIAEEEYNHHYEHPISTSTVTPETPVTPVASAVPVEDYPTDINLEDEEALERFVAATSSENTSNTVGIVTGVEESAGRRPVRRIKLNLKNM